MVGVIASLVQLFPTGDKQGRMIADNQPVTLAAMEGLFQSQAGAPLAILGQPDVPNGALDNPLIVPRALSFYLPALGSAEVRGLDVFPPTIGRIRSRCFITAIT